MKKQWLHVAAAFGAGMASFLSAAMTITPNPWWQAGCAAGLATLGGLGISVAYRTNPS